MKLVLPLLLLISAPVHAQAPGVWALQGGTVHRVSGPPIENGTVLIRGGLIEAVGPSVRIPPEATVIDVAGQHVYPGLIDAHSTLLISEPEASKGPTDGSGMAPPETSAATRVRDFIDWTRRDDVDAARASGITTIRASAKGRIFDGATPLVNLGEGTLEANVLKDEAAQQISFVPRSDRAYPGSLMGVIAHIRQTVLDARHQTVATSRYRTTPQGRQRPVQRDELRALTRAIDGRVPIVMVADTKAAIERALTLARELELQPIISGAVDAWASAERLGAGSVPVIVTTSFPKGPTRYSSEEPLRLLRRRVRAPEGPAELQRHGVRFAFGTHGASSSTLLTGARAAVRAGLSPEDALTALTLSPARMFGVERQLGSLEPGKIANVIVTDKPLLERDVRVVQILIDGQLLPEPTRKAEADPAAAAEGTWTIRVDTESGELTFNVTFSGEGEALTGTWTGREDSGDLSSVRASGSSIEFVLTTADRLTGDTSDWRFDGTIEGDRMEGTVSISAGVFRFEGRRH